MATRGQKSNAAAAAAARPETHLKSGSGRVALLLLGSFGARLTAGALPSRRLALASGHCERRIDAGWRLKMQCTMVRAGNGASALARGESRG